MTTLLPRHRNDGSPVSPEEENEILDEFWSTFGGATVEGTTRGVWVDDEDVFEDVCLKVVIECEADRYSEVESLIKAIGKRLGQKAMYFEVQYFDGVRFLRTDL